MYANNGDHAAEAMVNPAVPSGVLAQWDGKADKWTVVARNQFTEVTGPGGIYGSEHPDTDPIWAIGWDHRSLIFMCLDQGTWHRYRLPKASHSYDGAHGWNTEWPRIRDIGEASLLMTMHGAFWKFPKTFSVKQTSGIAPRSNYLKVIGDFTRWTIHADETNTDCVVFGCDDTANSEFLNKRKAKGNIAGPQSQSNLWFVEPTKLDDLGPVIGRGGVWVNDDIKASQTSDSFLVAGFERKGLHLSHRSPGDAVFELAVDEAGDGQWKSHKTVTVAEQEPVWVDLSELTSATWIRLSSDRDLVGATAWFQFSNADSRDSSPHEMFSGLASANSEKFTGGLARARSGNKGTLSLAAIGSDGSDIGYYELDGDLKLKKVEDKTLHDYAKEHTAIPRDVLAADDASVIYTDDRGRRWRLPRGDQAKDQVQAWGATRVAREVANRT